MKKLFAYLIIGLFVYWIITPKAFGAAPHSNSYTLQEYGFGSGGTDTNTGSGSYKLFGTAGEVESGRLSGSAFKAGTGLTYTLKLNVPPAPTLSNPGNTYDRLKIVVNTGSNTQEVLYAIAISTSSTFSSSVNYVKSDQTMGPSLTISDYKTFSNWGGASGFFVSLLNPNTTYYVRARAQIPTGNGYQETEWGPISSAVSTANSSLTFTLGSSTITFNDLNASNSYTDASQTTTLTTTTNAYNGYVVYAKETQSLTSSQGRTIADYLSTNSNPTSWNGTGFGYSTDDNNLLVGGGPANRFNAHTNYAGFTTSSSTPGDPVADNEGPVQSSQIINEVFTIYYKLVGANTTPAGTYTNTILYTIMPTY